MSQLRHVLVISRFPSAFGAADKFFNDKFYPAQIHRVGYHHALVGIAVSMLIVEAQPYDQRELEWLNTIARGRLLPGAAVIGWSFPDV